MKRFTLLFALMLFVSVTFAQKFVETTKAGLVDRELVRPLFQEAPALKFEGEVFYSETFDFGDATEERGWKLPDGWQIVDEGDFGNFWTWRAGTDSIKGNYTFEPGHIYSKTPEDGYFVLPMDEYSHRDGQNTANASLAWFQMPPIDCSGRGSVVMKLRQYFRCCCGAPDVKVRLSNDEGVHWADYSMRFGTNTNVFCERPIVELNVTEVAAGMPSVWVRFEWNTNDHYFWCVDDFELMEGYTNELQLEDVWVYMSDFDAEDEDEGYCYMTPLSQITSGLGKWTFSGALVNAGKQDQWSSGIKVDILQMGTLAHTAASETRDIWSLDRDTFDINDAYTPNNYGSYEFTITAVQEQEDAVPINNTYRDVFHVTDSIYSMSDWDWETYSSTASWGNNDGDYLGIVYDITEACEVNSLSVALMQREKNPQASTQLGYEFQYWIFEWLEDEDIWAEKINAEYGIVDEDNLNTWYTMPFEKDGESEFLEPGQYIAAIQVWHGGGDSPDNNVYRFTIGSDLDHKYSNGKTVYRLIDGEGWSTNSTDLSMIRMNLDYQGAPVSGAVQFNVDMTIPIANGYFHPEWEFVDVAGTINGWGGSDHMEDPDGDGIYTLTVSDVTVFENIEYKYRINGNWDTSEFPAGGPNRVYKTSYHNILHDVYNNGVSMGVVSDDLTSSINVYPNPSEGQFTLDVVNANPADLRILVTNLNGQVVYEKQVKRVSTYQETIDLSGFSKGLYFMRVNDKVTKLVVK